MRVPLVAAIFGLLSVAGQACDDDSPKATPAAGRSGVQFVQAPAGGEPVTHIVSRELERAARDDRQLVIYVGASWCEPCTRFKEAAKAGELDETFPNLRVLEFDLDRDMKRLAAAGCGSSMIPLFAKPRDNGSCDPNARIMGSVKGAGAVANLTPRLKQILGAKRRSSAGSRGSAE